MTQCWLSVGCGLKAGVHPSLSPNWRRVMPNRKSLLGFRLYYYCQGCKLLRYRKTCNQKNFPQSSRCPKIQSLTHFICFCLTLRIRTPFFFPSSFISILYILRCTKVLLGFACSNWNKISFLLMNQFTACTVYPLINWFEVTGSWTLHWWIDYTDGLDHKKACCYECWQQARQIIYSS